MLASLVTAAAMWLNAQRKQQPPPRTPPLGEDVARTYVTKSEFAQCQGICRKDIDAMRESISENDKKAEDRARGTHARIDKLYIEAQKTNVALGRITGIMIGKGIAPSAMATQDSQEG